MSCSNQSIDPLILPVYNSTVAGGTAYWVNIAVGEPPQLRNFKISTLDDSLSVADPGACSDSDDEQQCMAETGGIFQSTDSSTYRNVAGLAQWNGSHVSSSLTPVVFFNDNLRIGERTLTGFPMLQYARVSRQIIPNTLGLGNFSTLLATAPSSNLAPSTSFGLWVGSQHDNGSLIIGGYDEARISGRFSAFSTNGYDNPYTTDMRILKSIQYIAPNGSSSTILTNEQRESTAISPDAGNMVLKPSVHSAFLRSTGAMLYPAIGEWGWPQGTILGNLTIEFVNNFSITIPAEDLWQLAPATNATGEDSDETIMVSQVINNTSGFINHLGRPFMKSVYMKYHPEAQTFELARANTDPGVQSSIRSFCGTNDTAASGSSRSLPPAGPIAGGVVGGVLALVLCAGLAWFLLRRRRSQIEHMPLASEFNSSDDLKKSAFLPELAQEVRYEVPG